MAEKKENLHLVGLKVKNFLKIENFDYTFDGNSVKLVGANAAGKTSLFQAIWSACKGKNAIPPDSIHNDATKGEISLDIGPYIIRRTITENNAYLDITTKDGAKLMNPQSVLEGLIGEIALDPHAFMDMDPAKQALSAATIFGLRDSLAKADESIKTAFDDRAYANRKVKEIDAKLKSIVVPENLPAERVDLELITEQISVVDEAIRQVSEVEVAGLGVKNRNTLIDDNISDLQTQIDEFQKRLLAAKEDKKANDVLLEDARKNFIAANDKVKALPTRETLQGELAAAQETNTQFDASERFREVEKEAKTANTEAEKLDKKVTDLRDEKSKVIKGAKVTVPGLEFGDGILMLNGHPFETASYAERLRTSIAILMAQDPKLKLLTIQDASLMDKASWKVVEDFAKKNDFQVLYEVVGERDEKGDAPSSGLFIEDGSLAAIDGKKVEPEVEEKDS